MVRKKDVWVIVAVVALALASYGVMLLARSGQTATGMVEIYADGALYATASLEEAQTLRVEQASGEVNVIRIQDGGVYMESSTCKNQLCVQQGVLTADNWPRRALGRSIICLPNEVLVQLTLDESHPTMQDPDAPDI